LVKTNGKNKLKSWILDLYRLLQLLPSASAFTVCFSFYRLLQLTDKNQDRKPALATFFLKTCGNSKLSKRVKWGQTPTAPGRDGINPAYFNKSPSSLL